MEKIYAPERTTHKINVLVEDIQVATEHNIGSLGDAVFDSFGIKLTSPTTMLVTKTAPLTVTVEAGAGLTSSYKSIYISTLETISIPSGPDRTLSLYVQYVPHTVSTVRLNGSYAIVNGSSVRDVPYRTNDTYIFVMQDTALDAPVDSILLASLAIANNVVLVTDKRYTNILTAYSLVTGPSATDATVAGKTFVIAPATLPKPLHVRITDIDSSLRTPDLRDTSMTSLLVLNEVTNKARVSVKWGWDNLVGSHVHNTAADICTLQTTDQHVWAENELVGQHLYIYSDTIASFDYVISANGVSTGNGALCTLTVTPFGHMHDINNIVLGLPDNYVLTFSALIHSGANHYEIVATPKLNIGAASRSVPVIMVESYTADNYMPVISGDINIPVGYTVHIDVRGITNTTKSAWSRMAAGSFEKAVEDGWLYDVVQYTAPVLIKVPDIATNSSAITLKGEDTGFQVNIKGWDVATDFEVFYNTADVTGDPAQFAQRFITKQRELIVPIIKTGTYWVGARPLTAGQVVSDTLIQSIFLGSYGSSMETAVGNYPINLATYSGRFATALYDAVGGFTLDFGSLVTLHNGLSISALPTSVVGMAMTINGVDYRILALSGMQVKLGDISSNAIVTSLPIVAHQTIFSIGTSKIGRFIASVPVGNSTITRVAVVVMNKFGTLTSTNIRIYPNASEGEAKNVIITNGADSNISVTTNLALNGKLLIIDGYDTSNLLNNSALTGNITLFAKASA